MVTKIGFDDSGVFASTKQVSSINQSATRLGQSQVWLGHLCHRRYGYSSPAKLTPIQASDLIHFLANEERLRLGDNPRRRE